MTTELRQQALQAAVAVAAASGDHGHVLADAELFAAFLGGESS